MLEPTNEGVFDGFESYLIVLSDATDQAKWLVASFVSESRNMADNS